jgi:hypothetical protein
LKLLGFILAPSLLLTKRKRYKGALMAAQAVLFVSKRLQRMAFAFLCLAMAQVVLSSCEPDLTVPALARTIGE